MRSTKRKIVAAATSLGLAAAAFGAEPAAAAPTLTWKGYTLSVAKGLVGEKTKTQAYNRRANVAVNAAGDLVITTSRHCVPGGRQPGEKAKANPGRCDKLGNTVYSSGRVQLAGPAGVNFKVSFRARMAGNGQPGTRSALWMVAGGYCGGKMLPAASNLGELDALEWYGSTRRETTASSHLTCDSAAEDKILSKTANKAFNPGEFHTWTVVRKGNNITYRIDNRVVGKHECGKGMFTREGVVVPCDTILNQPWTIIMQGEVFRRPPGGKLLSGPDDTKPFPTQQLVIRNLTIEPV